MATINAPTSIGVNASNLSGQTSISHLYTASASIGDLVWVAVGFGGTSSPASIAVSDDAGNTFAPVVQADKTTNQTPHAWIFFCILTNPVTTANRLTATPNVAFNVPILIIARQTVTGGTWAATIDRATTAIGQSTSPSSGATAATTAANEAVFVAICTGSPQTVTFNNNNTALVREQVSGSSKALDTGYQILASTGTPQGSGTITSADWAAAIATIAAVDSAATYDGYPYVNAGYYPA